MEDVEDISRRIAELVVLMVQRLMGSSLEVVQFSGRLRGRCCPIGSHVMSSRGARDIDGTTDASEI